MKINIVKSLQEINLELDHKRAEKASDYEEVIPVVKEYESIIRSQKRGIPNVAFSQGKIFKPFKDSERFEEMVKWSKST